MSATDIGIIIIIIVITVIFMALFSFIRSFKIPKTDVYNFDNDMKLSSYNPKFQGKKPKNIGNTGNTEKEATFIGLSANKKNVFIENDAKHVFVCGTTGSGKTIALANFIRAGADYNYPMLIIDGKGDTDKGSFLEITKELCPDRNIYIINLNEPGKSDKYNPFKNTNTDVIKDMLINMTNWSEEHYKYNTERYIARLCKLLALKNIDISLNSLTRYLPTDSFTKLSMDLSKEDLISKEEHIENIELSKTSGKIAESAAARFATNEQPRRKQRGIELKRTLLLHMRNLPGRKSDVADAEWIATLLQHGLLTSSFIPPRAFRNLREASRLYKKFIAEKSRYVNRLNKLLSAHGFKLSSVFSNILCVSGHAVLTALAQRGSLSLEDVKGCMRGNLKHSAEEIHAACSGSLLPEECAMLSLILYKIEMAENDINSIVELMKDMAKPFKSALELLDSIPGIDILAALLLLAEITDKPHQYFDSPERLVSWAGLCPRNDESAGKLKSRKIMPGNPYIKSILCQIAWVAVKSRNNPFRDWFWSHAAKLGRKKAIIAVSRKILTVIYMMLKNGELFYPPQTKAG